MTKYNWICCLVCCALLLSSCSQSTIFEKQYVLQDGIWTYDEVLNFSFEITDTSKLYDVFLELEHSTNYEFENLYINIITSYPDSKQDTQMVSLELANAIGMWLGDCGKHTCELNIPIQQKVFFIQEGAYSISLEQYMRKEALQNVNELGLKIEAVGKR